jgi:hypothetical protein
MITMLGGSCRPQQRPGTSTSSASTNGGDLQVANHREHSQQSVNIDMETRAPNSELSNFISN